MVAGFIDTYKITQKIQNLSNIPVYWRGFFCEDIIYPFSTIEQQLFAIGG